MNLVDLVTSRELSEKLKAAGVKQDSLFVWGHYGIMPIGQAQDGSGNFDTTVCSAYLFEELAVMLPGCREVEGQMLPLDATRYPKHWAVGYGDMFAIEERIAEACGELVLKIKEGAK